MLDLGLLLGQLVVILSPPGWRACSSARWAAAGDRRDDRRPRARAIGPGCSRPGRPAALFPADRLVPLAALSQLGVLLYMFVVGLRLDLALLRGRRHAAVAVSHASIVAPFLLGAALAPLLHPTLAPPASASCRSRSSSARR
jgi:Kef-type K+ transport system membrane component KefB